MPPTPAEGRRPPHPDLQAAFEVAERHTYAADLVRGLMSLAAQGGQGFGEGQFVLDTLREVRERREADVKAVSSVADELSLARARHGMGTILVAPHVLLNAHVAALALTRRIGDALRSALVRSASAMAEPERWKRFVSNILHDLDEDDLGFLATHSADACRFFSGEGLPDGEALKAEAYREMLLAEADRPGPPRRAQGPIPPDRFAWGDTVAENLSRDQWRFLEALCDGERLRPSVPLPDVIRHVYGPAPKAADPDRALLALRSRVERALTEVGLTLSIDRSNGCLRIVDTSRL
jgi:hypothetical protein